MHFAKTYTKLLHDLPPEFRENGIQYGQLKKLIHQIVSELDSLGLGPDVLQNLLEAGNGADFKGKQKELSSEPQVVYEFSCKSGKIEPRLRISITSSPEPSPSVSTASSATESDSIEQDLKNMSLLWALQRNSAVQGWGEVEDSPQITEVTDSEGSDGERKQHPIVASDNQGTPKEVVIPLVKDSAFFELLSTALHKFSDRFSILYADYVETLETLSMEIGDCARPVSSHKHNFHPHSVLSNPGTISLPSRRNQSDLYSWREIFQLYLESEVFETLNGPNPGELPVSESEKRLKLFAERVTGRGLGDIRKLRSKQSRGALESFLELNLFILNMKKLEQANAEAMRKILKKHAKRTSLPPLLPSGQNYQEYYLHKMAIDFLPRSSFPLPVSTTSSPSRTASFTSASFSHILIQALGSTLLPIIPHIDDYSCIICTNIAFKPIRLTCGHLFCVRCLVKMQKRGQGNCPMCRAPTVLTADSSNVDWALLNFLEDWFPLEAHEKLKASEKEATDEQYREMGFDPDQKCIIM